MYTIFVTRTLALKLNWSEGIGRIARRGGGPYLNPDGVDCTAAGSAGDGAADAAAGCGLLEAALRAPPPTPS
jgi:hypothetical protein